MKFYRYNKKLCVVVLSFLLVIGQAGLACIVRAGSGTPNADQLYYRFREDLDGLNVDTSGWLAGQNGEIADVAKNDVYRVRFTVSQEGTYVTRNLYPRMQYGTNADCITGMTTVPATATTEPFDLELSGQFADGEATTTNLLTAGEDNWQNGAGYESSILGIKFGLEIDYYSEYEFSFQANNNAADSGVYYLRMSDFLDNYSACAKLTLAAGGGILSTDIVNSGGTPVGSPIMGMSAKDFSFFYQTSTGTFGVNDQRIRVDNGTANPEWNLTLAADGGATSFWDGTVSDYDFNDPTAEAGDGADDDGFGGQMTIDPSVMTIGGTCTETGLIKGNSDAFEEGPTNDITLLTAGATADTGCYWDLTGIGVSQTIPAEQGADGYDIDMTLTVTAI